MSSATVSLFVSVAFAILGAALFAFIMTHPGQVASVSLKFLRDAHLLSEKSALTLAKDAPTVRSRKDANVTTIDSNAFGHFTTQAEINRRAIEVVVDTGATFVALTYEDADRIGIFVNPSDFTSQIQTANGIARFAPVTIDEIRIGAIKVRNVKAVVGERGKLEHTLLGMSFLGKLSRVEMRDHRLLLQE